MARQYNLQVETVECDGKTLVDAMIGKRKPLIYCDIIIEDIKIKD